MVIPLTKAPLYHLARKTGLVRLRPLNLTFSVTYRCPARCQTCNVWKKRVADLTLAEYDRLFANLGSSVYWATFSGGEPFLRRDLIDIVLSCYERCQPAIVTIPTSGLLHRQVVDGVDRLSRRAPDLKVVINFSLDGIGARHDQLRGVPGNYERMKATYQALRAANHPNVTVGIHSVVSRMNAGEFDALRRHVRAEFQPDSFISEVAEERVELDTIGLDITPTPDEYRPVVDSLVADIDETPARGFAGIVQSFRREYYTVAHRTITEKRQVLPCYAGLASAHVSPDGDVWACCTRAEPMGNLRATHFDFDQVWRSQTADEMRASIRKGECACPLANAAYSSMLCDPRSVARVGMNWVKQHLKPSSAQAPRPQDLKTPRPQNVPEAAL